MKKTQESPYLIWRDKDEPRAAALYEFSEFDDSWKLYEGIPVQNIYPPDATYAMDPDFPRDSRVTDSLSNNLNLLIVTSRLKDFLTCHIQEPVEYLPLGLIDPEGRPLPDQVYIVNPYPVHDCLDIRASGGKWSLLDEESLDSIKRIVLDPARIDPARALFRLKYFWNIVLIKRELAQAILESGFTGVEFLELKDWKG